MIVNAEKYRSCTDYREILRALQKASTQTDNFIWQSTALGKNVIPVHHFEIDFVTREVNVFIDFLRFKIDQELPIYMKLDYRVSVFKVTDYNQEQQCITFAFPKEVKTIELRSAPRAAINPNHEKFAMIKTPKANDQGPELKVRVTDISHEGLGILVSELNRSFLKNNRILWITQLQDTQLESPILAEVVYINSDIDPKFHNRKQKSLKVGLKLSSMFPSEEYQKFIQ